MISFTFFKRTIFVVSLILLSVLSLLFVEGYRLSFQKEVRLEQRGVLVLTGNEKNVVIRINDTFIKTNLPYVTTALPLGNHSLEVTKAGFLSYKQPVFLENSRATIHNIVLETAPDIHHTVYKHDTPKQRLYVLDRTLVGEYFLTDKTLYLYESFDQLTKQHPSRKLSLAQVAEEAMPDYISFLSHDQFVVRYPEKDYLLSTTDLIPVEVRLPQSMDFPRLLTEYLPEDSRSIVFHQFRPLLEQFFNTSIVDMIYRSRDQHTYVVTDTHIYLCEYLIPAYCTPFITLQTPPGYVLYWEKENVFLIRGKENNQTTIVQTAQPVPQGFPLLPSSSG